MEYLSHSYEDTFEFAENFSKKLKKGDFIALYGDLGAGKTCFVSGLARGLNCKGNISSPTFTIMNYYSGDLDVAHFDMYRITEDMLEDIGFYDSALSDAVTVCEWSENIPGAVPANAYRIYLTYGEKDDDRIIKTEEPD